MYDVDCPYCEANVEIEYEGDETFIQHCDECDKNFAVNVQCEPVFSSNKDCGANSQKHHLVQGKYCQGYTKYKCKDCEFMDVEMDDYPKKFLREQIIIQERAVE